MRTRHTTTQPMADPWAWQKRGVCRGRAHFFFYEDGDRIGGPPRHRELRARQLCEQCPVRAQCAAYALRLPEPYGIWGGFTEAERQRIIAIGWEDLADEERLSVDIRALERRLRDWRRARRLAGYRERTRIADEGVAS
jgi:WhiB family transcriptional regulator, redox-sensing transcriptional regulator